ncbi:hypothetical protein N7532_003896 [Penicillium argentinense]|uniref:V-type ATPase n=1 Tax=Penicillium argentinense TaxID=1131581 RepID=A0A9W9KFL9_9EURO|nr:uncharacterized protein N7532_003896 [Penicillium argentinense]KAJ5103367.1 hypothetical protein N7532_003896 [Penicillium argentinense]
MYSLLTLQPALPRLARSSRRVQRSSICANRSIATKSSGDAPFAYTWLAKRPYNINPDDVVSSLPSSPLAKDTIPLLLVTPGFAHWLAPTDVFLGNLLNRLYSGSDSIYAVAAVVDKLPNSNVLAFKSPSSERDGASFEDSESEGLSLLAVPELNVQGKAAPPRRIGGPAAEQPDIGVSVDAADLTTYQIGLRLAQTIFVNGKESTLFGMRWTRDNGNASSDALVLNNSVDLINCIVKTSSPTTDIQSSLTLPLHPVGQRRKVISSMGNILREVSKSTDPASVAPMPASTELEKELPRYIAENNIVDQRVSVWALVEKPGTTISCSQDGVLESVLNGGRLHRVMSGGGGWGKKQGLLSLDPEIGFPGTAGQVELDHLDDLFSPNTSKMSDLPPLFNEMVGDDLSMLSQVAAEGDFIQFYVSTDPIAAEHDASEKKSAHEEAISYCFGVVSNAEEAHGQDVNAGREDIVVLPNAFGALSEKAITYSQFLPKSENQDQEAVEWACHPSTKLDIPGCRVELGPSTESA